MDVSEIKWNLAACRVNAGLTQEEAAAKLLLRSSRTNAVKKIRHMHSCLHMHRFIMFQLRLSTVKSESKKKIAP